MKTITTPAIILRRIDYGEADRILTLITPEHGKVSAIAKGSRRAKSKLAGGLELFSITDIHAIDGRGELKTIISVRLQKHFGSIATDLDRTLFAYDCLKAVDHYTDDQCEKEYFELINVTLESLNDPTIDLGVVQAWFMSRLLYLFGAHMNLEHQVNGAIFSENETYVFDFDNMAFLAHRPGTYAPRHIKFMRLLSKVSAPKNLLHVADAHKIAGDVLMLLKQSLELAHR
jgi:DNA repair protein RecO